MLRTPSFGKYKSWNTGASYYYGLQELTEIDLCLLKTFKLVAKGENHAMIWKLSPKINLETRSIYLVLQWLSLGHSFDPGSPHGKWDFPMRRERVTLKTKPHHPQINRFSSVPMEKVCLAWRKLNGQMFHRGAKTVAATFIQLDSKGLSGPKKSLSILNLCF